MIEIGLTGWGDHDTLYNSGLKQTKLEMYSAHFPIVELDSSYYAILPEKNYVKWIKETPEHFRFVVKAHQGLTGQEKKTGSADEYKQLMDQFKASLTPLIDHDKLGMILFQFPPWFKAEARSIQLLRYIRQETEGFSVAIEFRHQSWYQEEMQERTLQFLEKNNFLHTICDEPQTGEGSVPIAVSSAGQKKVLIRLHGRNAEHWVNRGQPNWRDLRYRYDYSQEELREWAERLEQLQKETNEIYMIFNNNSAGHAAPNAKQLQSIMGLTFEGLNDQQLDLFDD